MLTKAPRGTMDVLPSEAIKWQYIEEQIRKICRDFGFGEIRTPTFEHTELILRGVGETTDIVQKEMYTFEDKGKRSITLKPEGTAPAARAYIEHNVYSEAQPTKYYYITPAFRYERPQAGRLREFHQFGVEMYGSPSPSADAEVISLAMAFLERLGIKNLKVNVNSLGCGVCKAEYNAKLVSYFREKVDSLCDTCKERFEKNPLRILDCKNEGCKEIAKGAPLMIDSLCTECNDHFEKLQLELKEIEISFVVDPYIVRGLDYYTKTVFEIISENIGAQSTVCGGGRYDNLIKECGGPDTPAVGFGLGMERLIMTLENSGLDLPIIKGPDVYIASLGDRASLEAAKITLNLRRNGISCEKDLMSRSLKAQMKYANKINATWTVVLGEDEINSDTVRLKNMSTGEEAIIKLSNIVEEIKTRS